MTQLFLKLRSLTLLDITTTLKRTYMRKITNFIENFKIIFVIHTNINELIILKLNITLNEIVYKAKCGKIHKNII